MVEVESFRFKLRTFSSLLPPTTMSGINAGDEVSDSPVGLLPSRPGTENMG